MITPSFSPTATERVLPKLALDFTTASLDARVTFARTTDATHPATYVNSSGYITSATNNQPRFDYDPVTLACKGLLIEESRANLITASQQAFNDTTYWTKTGGVTVSDSNVTSPEGTSTGSTVTGVNSVTTYLTSAQITLSASTNYAFSLFIKAGTSIATRVRIYNGALSAEFAGVVILWTAGVPSTSSTSGTWVTAPTYTSFGNGWYRVTGVFSSGAQTNAKILIYPDTNAVGNTSQIYGAQLETGAFATSYIPTTTTALTRNADVATMTGTNLTDWCDVLQGTILSEHTVPQFNSANTIYAYSLGSAAAVEIYAGLSTAGNNQFTVINTTNQANFAGFAAGTLNTPQKVCGYYKANNFAASANAVAGGTDLSGSVPTINKLVFGARNDGARVLNGWVRKFSYWPFNLTTAELTAFSKQ